MKKKALQICSLLGLVVILAVVSAEAQTITQYKANIPFDFNIGNKIYPAGEYVVGVKDAHSQWTVLQIGQAQGRRDLRVMPALQSGSRSKGENTQLVFSRSGNRYDLTSLISTDFGLTLNKSKVKRLAAKNPNSKPETVAINLIR